MDVDMPNSPFPGSSRVARERVRIDREFDRVVAESPCLAPSSCDVVPATVVGDAGGVRHIVSSLLRCMLGDGTEAAVSLRSLGDGYVLTVSGPVGNGQLCAASTPIDFDQTALLAARMGGTVRSRREPGRDVVEFWLAAA